MVLPVTELALVFSPMTMTILLRRRFLFLSGEGVSLSQVRQADSRQNRMKKKKSIYLFDTVRMLHTKYKQFYDRNPVRISKRENAIEYSYSFSLQIILDKFK